MNDHREKDVTDLLRQVSDGRASAVNRLIETLYDDLRALAQHHLKQERADHTLDATALVHEAYLKLVNQNRAAWEDRAHFFAVASRIIRQILVDHARARATAKRGGGRRAEQGVIETLAVGSRNLDLLALEDALTELASLHARQAELVTLRFFGGLSLNEAAAVLGVSERTIDADWSVARAWLQRRLRTD
jgi:RNA polymerase sigma factor (TIGR02999 family)